MKGNVVMRFVGNKQEPEEFPVNPAGWCFATPEFSKAIQEMEEWMLKVMMLETIEHRES